MSTRGTFGFHCDGKDYLSYNHSDSYPESLGNRMLKQLRDILPRYGVEGLREAVRKLECVEQNGKVSTLTESQKERLKRFSDDLGSPGRDEDEIYALAHEMQGRIDAIIETGIIALDNNFVRDSLFCEWGYVVNLDLEELEVYRGFNKSPEGEGRYAHLPEELDPDSRKKVPEYYGIVLIDTLPLNELPDTMAPYREEEDDE